MAPVKTEEKRISTEEQKQQGRLAIARVLARTVEDGQFLARLNENPGEVLNRYYTLTPEEVAALISGDIRKIESWLGKLDQSHATWLWNRLSQEKW